MSLQLQPFPDEAPSRKGGNEGQGHVLAVPMHPRTSCRARPAPHSACGGVRFAASGLMYWGGWEAATDGGRFVLQQGSCLSPATMQILCRKPSETALQPELQPDLNPPLRNASPPPGAVDGRVGLPTMRYAGCTDLRRNWRPDRSPGADFDKHRCNRHSALRGVGCRSCSGCNLKSLHWGVNRKVLCCNTS